MGVAREKAYFLCTLGMKMVLRALWLPKVGGRHGDPLKVITKYGLKTAHICVMTPGLPRVITQQKKILNSLESKLSDDFRIFFLLVIRSGFEPETPSLKGMCSTC